MKTIAQRAGVGKATIYRFFPSKDALLLTVVEENLTAIRDLVLGELLNGAPPLQRLENVCRAVARFLESERDFSRLLIQEAGEFLGPIQQRYLRLVEDNLPVADAFFTALMFPNLFRRVFAEGAFAQAFVPAYSRTLEAEGPEAAEEGWAWWRWPSAPRRHAATCAERSAMFCAMLRAGYSPDASNARMSASQNRPSSTISTLSKMMPSSTIVVLSGGIDPGRVPPISAWWARLTTQAISRSSAKTGVARVRSGRCEPPWARGCRC